MSELPQPSADALAQSARLLERIEAEIAAAGGWISFARYMELALYAPGLGYYSGGARKFGPGGDFIFANRGKRLTDPRIFDSPGKKRQK